MQVEDRTSSEERALERNVDTAAWGVFFLWVGVALLAEVGWGVGLIGAGVITLAAQAARRFLGLKVDRFSLIVGVLFAVVGIWNVLAVRADVVPVLFIAAGVALLASAWRRRDRSGARTGAEAPAQTRT